MTNFEALKTLLLSPQNIVIIPHKNPDGDAIGSSLALYQYLIKAKHQVNILSPNEFPKFLKWLPCANKITIAEYDWTQTEKTLNNADLIFCLDFNTLSRIEEMAEMVEKTKAKKVVIDHHQQPGEFDFVYSDTNVPATCQMIFHFLDALDALPLIDKDLATCIYTGIMTDTGNFRHNSTTATTHRVVAHLMDVGVDVAEINNKVFDTNNLSRLLLLAKTLENIEVLPQYKTTILYLTKDELLKNGYEKGDTEGFVNYGLSLDNYQFSAMFTEDTKKDIIKISFRSKGSFDVNQFARKYFNGGGHVNAAGGKSDKPLQQTISDFKTYLTIEFSGK